MKMCPKCGKEMPDEYSYCVTCGEKVENSSDSTAEITGSDSEEAAEVQVEEKSEEAAEVPAEEKSEEATEVLLEEKSEETAEVLVEEVSGEAAEEAAETPAEEKAEPAAAAPSNAEPVVNSPVQIPVPEVKKSGKGKKTGIIAGVIALLAVVGVSAMAVVKSDMFKDPKETVIEAFKSVYEEERVSHLDEIFGFTEMNEFAKTQNTEVGLKLKYDGSTDYSTEDFIGSGIEIIAKNDVENKKSSAMVGVQYQGMDLLHADAYLDEKEIMIAVPELSSKVFTINYADDLQGQIENSPFLGLYIDEMGIDLDAMTEYLEYAYSLDSREEDTPFDLVALWERYKTGSQAIENLKAAMTVERGDKATVTVDGKEEKCRAYNAVIPGEAVLSFLRTSSDFFLEDETLKKDVLEYLTQVLQLSESMDPYSYETQDPEDMRDEAWEEAETTIDDLLNELEDILQDDIKMLIYVDSKGRLVSLKAETELTSEDEIVSAEFTAALKGGDYLTQNADLELKLYDDEHELVATLNKEESYDGNILLCDIDFEMLMDDDTYGLVYTGSYQADSGEYQLNLVMNTDYDTFQFTMDGVVTDLEKGKRMEATADSIRVEYDGDYVELSGSYVFKPLEGDVTVLEGDLMDILAATETDYNEVGMEIFLKAMELSSKLQ